MKSIKKSILWAFIVTIYFTSCDFGGVGVGANDNQEVKTDKIHVDAKPVGNASPLPDTPSQHKYAWKKETGSQNSLMHRVVPPEGFQRTKVEEDSYADWLRNLPLKSSGSKVLLHNGNEKGNQNAHFAVVDMDVGKADLQQCADAIMRVKSEYHFQKAEYGRIHFNFTSGHNVSFDDWRKGRKPSVQGNKVVFSSFGSGTDNSYGNFRKYLVMIFSYAGTASLEKELISVDLSEMRIGDLFIQGGFPGHAILVLDMAENPETGEKLFLLGQSYMPAQEFHILRNYSDSDLSPWYNLDFGDILETPEWTFRKTDLKRFRD